MPTFHLQDVRCFSALSLPLDGKVVVLIGENGAGKTTIAELLASLCHGDEEGLDRFPVRHGAKAGRVWLTEGDETIAQWRSDGQRQRLPAERWLFGYGRYRRVSLPDAPVPMLGDVPILGPEFSAIAEIPLWRKDLQRAIRTRRTTTLTRADSHLLTDTTGYLVEIWRLRKNQPQMARAWRRLQEVITGLGEGLEGMSVQTRDDRDVVVLTRAGTPLLLSELSDGYQSILVILFDLIIRYIHLFADLEDPLAGKAWVIIDEVDLHLHPRWQRRIIQQLTDLFPGTRFLLTTHSVAVVQGAIDQGHDVFSLKSTGGAAQATRLDVETRAALEGAEVGSLWVADRLFDAGSLYSPRFEALEDRAEELREVVADGGGEAERAELIAVLERLRLLQVREEERKGRGALMSELAASQIAFLKRLEQMMGAG